VEVGPSKASAAEGGVEDPLNDACQHRRRVADASALLEGGQEFDFFKVVPGLLTGSGSMQLDYALFIQYVSDNFTSFDLGKSIKKFFRSVCFSSIPPTTAANKHLWPVPIPFPCVVGNFGGNFRTKCLCSKSDVVCQVCPNKKVGPVCVFSAAECKLINLQILVLSWIHLHKPCFAPASMHIGTQLSGEQWEIVQHFGKVNKPYFSQKSDSEDIGRSAMKVENVSSALFHLRSQVIANRESIDTYTKVRERSACFQYPNDGIGDPFTTPTGKMLHKVKLEPAKDIEADRLNFPNKPSVDPSNIYDEETLEAYTPTPNRIHIWIRHFRLKNRIQNLGSKIVSKISARFWIHFFRWSSKMQFGG